MCSSSYFSKINRTGGEEEVKESNKKILQGIIRIRKEHVIHKWPPTCNGILHQPKRPKNKDVKTASLLSEQRNET